MNSKVNLLNLFGTALSVNLFPRQPISLYEILLFRVSPGYLFFGSGHL